MALLHGAPGEMILRPRGENYDLVGSVDCVGLPGNLWPVDGDEEGVHEITLV
jgi:hypothetical protein